MKKESRLIAITGLILFLSVFLFAHDEYTKLSAGKFAVVLAVLAVISSLPFVWKQAEQWKMEILSYTVTGGAVLCLMQITNYLRLQSLEGNGVLLAGTIIVGIVGLIAFSYIVWNKKEITEGHVLWLIFLIFMLRLLYVVLTQAHYFQNDVYSFAENQWGHLGYVYQLFTYGKIPDVDPTTHYQMYQPPLHYVICTLAARLFTLLGRDIASVDEYLQMLPLFYSAVILVFLNKIARELKISTFGRFVIIGLAGFLPYGFIMAAALNNDPLMTLFMVMALYYTIVWYQKPTLKHILAMAVCIGCAMMSKLSGALIAPAMAVVMLTKAWQLRKEWKQVVKQFFCFGCVAFPLGLWHSISRLLRYGMPLGFVPALSEELEQFIGQISKYDRFVDFQGAFDTLCIRWGYDGFADYNILTTLWKYAVFGETSFYNNNPVTENVATILFYLTGLLLVLLILGSVRYLAIRNQQVIHKVLLWGSALVVGFMFVKFCIMYPFVCTMNIRYIMVAVYCAMVMLGAVLAEGLQKRVENGRGAYIYRGIIGTLLAVYMIFSFLLYWNLEMLIK